MRRSVAQLCLTLCNPVDCSLPGSSVIGTFQARTLEWVAISFSRGSSRPRDRTRVFGFFTTVPPGKPKHAWGSSLLKSLSSKQGPCSSAVSCLPSLPTLLTGRRGGAEVILLVYHSSLVFLSFTLSTCLCASFF